MNLSWYIASLGSTIVSHLLCVRVCVRPHCLCVMCFFSGNSGSSRSLVRCLTGVSALPIVYDFMAVYSPGVCLLCVEFQSPFDLEQDTRLGGWNETAQKGIWTPIKALNTAWCGICPFLILVWFLFRCHYIITLYIEEKALFSCRLWHFFC